MKSLNKWSKAMCTVKNLHIDDTDKTNMETALRLFNEFMADNSNAPKKGTFNIWNWAADKTEPRAALRGVYHDPEGYAVATDGHMLIASRAEYRAEHVDKIVDFYGNDIIDKYPRWRSVFPQNTTEYEEMDIDGDFVRECEKKRLAYQKSLGRGSLVCARVAVGNCYFDLKRLLSVLTVTNKIKVCKANSFRPAYFENEDFRLLIAPCEKPAALRDASAKAFFVVFDNFEVITRDGQEISVPIPC